MFLFSNSINSDSLVSDIVKLDHRAAEIFRKHEIDYCCGGRWPLRDACVSRGIDTNDIIDELRMATRTLRQPHAIPYSDWNFEFFTAYLVNMHHDYLRKALPTIKCQLSEFVSKHKDRFPELPELELRFDNLSKKMIPQLAEEEEIIFPYIRQLENASKGKNRDMYGVLFVRAMRKPLDAFLRKGQEWLPAQLQEIRKLTNNYTCPTNACIKHRVVFGLLQELDNDIQQHYYLENDILLPRAIEMQEELLSMSST